MDINPVNMFETMVNVVKNNKMFDIVKTFLIFVLLVYITYNITELPKIVKNVFNARTTELQMEHDTAVERRRSIKPQIDAILFETMNTLNADRIYVIEMHNGTNNTSGLPFIYGEMTYEQARRDVEHVDEDYVSINLSRFEYPLYLEKNQIFCGTIDDLAKIDERLAFRLKATNATYVGGVAMNGVENELGYIGITYCNTEPVGRQEIIRVLSIASQKLTALLDMSTEEEPEGS
jgi:hypothetical protein